MVAKFKEKERERSCLVLNCRFSMEAFLKKFFDGPAIQKENLEEVENAHELSCKLQDIELRADTKILVIFPFEQNYTTPEMSLKRRKSVKNGRANFLSKSSMLPLHGHQ